MASLADKAVVSIAAGLCFTVVVTADGLVWQMGETGAAGKGVPWEGCLVPTQVLACQFTWPCKLVSGAA